MLSQKKQSSPKVKYARKFHWEWQWRSQLKWPPVCPVSPEEAPFQASLKVTTGQLADGCFLSDMGGQRDYLAEYFQHLNPTNPPKRLLPSAGLQMVDADPLIDGSPLSWWGQAGCGKVKGGEAPGDLSVHSCETEGESMIHGPYEVLTAILQSGTVPLTGKGGWSSLSRRDSRLQQLVHHCACPFIADADLQPATELAQTWPVYAGQVNNWLF